MVVHDAGDDADLVVQHLGERRQAIGRAGCVRDHRVARLQDLLIHAVDDRRVDIVAAGRGNHDLLRTRGQMRRRLGLAREQARAFEHDVDAELAPRQFRRIALRDHADPVAVDDHRVAVDVHVALEPAMHGVEAGQMRVGVGIAEIVDRHDLDLALVWSLVQGAQNVAADAAIAVDADLDCHLHDPLIASESSVSLPAQRSIALTTCSTVNPKCLNKSFAGADAPK